MKKRLDRPRSTSKEVRDGGFGPVLVEPQHHGGALTRREPAEDVVEHLGRVDGHVGCRKPEMLTFDLLPPHPVGTAVDHRNPHIRTRLIDSVPPAVQRDKRLLNDLLSNSERTRRERGQPGQRQPLVLIQLSKVVNVVMRTSVITYKGG